MINDEYFEKRCNLTEAQEYMEDLIENVIGSPTTVDVSLVAIVTDEDGSVSITKLETDNEVEEDYRYGINQENYTPMVSVENPSEWRDNLYTTLNEKLMESMDSPIDGVYLASLVSDFVEMQNFTTGSED